MAKQVQANHGGPSVARMTREKSVRALRIGKKSHMALPITISGDDGPLARMHAYEDAACGDVRGEDGRQDECDDQHGHGRGIVAAGTPSSASPRELEFPSHALCPRGITVCPESGDEL